MLLRPGKECRPGEPVRSSANSRTPDVLSWDGWKRRRKPRAAT